MAALDLLGRRWSLRLLWELRGGPVGARALLERCDGLSSSVLYDRGLPTHASRRRPRHRIGTSRFVGEEVGESPWEMTAVLPG
jgi:hypothetical protein